MSPFVVAAALLAVAGSSSPAIELEAAPQSDTVVTGLCERDGYAPQDTALAKVRAPLPDVPQSIAVVIVAVLRDPRPPSVQDALKNVPGDGFSSGDRQSDQVTIRGFHPIADQFVHGLNGRPVNVDPSTCDGAATARDADAVRSGVIAPTVTFLHRCSEDMSFRNGVRHDDYTLRHRNTQPTAVNAAVGTVTLSHGGIDRDEDGGPTRLRCCASPECATLLYGVEIARQEKDSRALAARVIAVTPLLRPVNPAVDNAAFSALSASQLNHLDTTAVYVQNMADFSHGVKAEPISPTPRCCPVS